MDLSFFLFTFVWSKDEGERTKDLTIKEGYVGIVRTPNPNPRLAQTTKIVEEYRIPEWYMTMMLCRSRVHLLN